MHVRYPVEGFAEIDEGSKDSIRLLEIKRRMDEVQEFYQIVHNGRALHTILPRIHVRQDDREKPVSNEGFINFAEEEGSGDGPEVILTGGRKHFWNRHLGFLHPLPGVFSRSRYFVVNS